MEVNVRYRGFNISEIEVAGEKTYSVDPALWRERGIGDTPPIPLSYSTLSEVLTWVDAIWQTPPKYEADEQLHALHPDDRSP